MAEWAIRSLRHWEKCVSCPQAFGLCISASFPPWRDPLCSTTSSAIWYSTWPHSGLEATKSSDCGLNPETTTKQSKPFLPKLVFSGSLLQLPGHPWRQKNNLKARLWASGSLIVHLKAYLKRSDVPIPAQSTQPSTLKLQCSNLQI